MLSNLKKTHFRDIHHKGDQVRFKDEYQLVFEIKMFFLLLTEKRETMSS